MKHSERGMTLVEMLITVVIFVMLTIGVASLLRMMITASVQQPLTGDSVDKVQAVMTAFMNEMRDASTGDDGSYPINEASSTEIIFFTKYGSAGSTTANRIRYYLSASKLYRGVITPSGSPATYPTANEVKYVVATNIMNSTTSVFSYYDGNYAGTSTALTQPVNINLIRYVQISLMPQMLDVRNATNTFSIQTGVAVRNLKNNLGN